MTKYSMKVKVYLEDKYIKSFAPVHNKWCVSNLNIVRLNRNWNFWGFGKKGWSLESWSF